jgi:transcriptional regulator with XRE-family HTH domain
MMTAQKINLEIGRRLKNRRQILGLSQAKMGEQLGITFQQMQKYEQGKNRISAASLFELCHANKIDIKEIYREAVLSATDSQPGDVYNDLTEDGGRQLTKLIASYHKISNDRVRKSLVD